MKDSAPEPYPFRKIATALAFSPRAEAILHEGCFLVERFQATLVLIHVGERKQELEDRMDRLIERSGIEREACRIVWREGKPAETILEVCEEEEVDLLLLGALRKEKLYAYYLGSVARRIARSAPCSVLLLVEPSEQGQYYGKLVVNGLDHPKTPWTMRTAFYFARIMKARELRIVEEVPPDQVQVRIEDDETRKEAIKERQSVTEQEHQRVSKLVEDLDPGNIEVRQQCIFGKPGYTIGHYAEAEKADLLVLNSPDKKTGILERFFPRGIEYILSDMPTNVLLVHSKAYKEER